jgi:Tol biopolymer transport system component
MRLPQSPLLGAFERKSGRIVFQGIDGNLYLTDQAASERLALTTDAGVGEATGPRRTGYALPTWSPVDDRVAFARYTFEEDNLVQAEIRIARSAEDDPLVVFEDLAEYPIFLYWSPDGAQLSFLTSQRADQRYVLRVVDAEGGEPRVVDVGRPVYWAWSPDGRHLLAHLDGAAADSPGFARLSLLSIGEHIGERGLGLLPLDFQAPALDPTGELALLAAEVEGGPRGLLVATLNGEVRSEIAPLENAAAFAWAPQGSYAAYIASDPESEVLVGRLRLLDLQDPETPVTTELGEEPVIGFAWSPDGERLAYFAPVFASPEGDPTAEATAADLLLRLVVAETRTGVTRRIGTFRPTEAFLDLLPFFDQYQHSVSIWSPDGDNLVFTAVTDDGQSAVFVIPSSGTVDPRPIAPGTLAFWSWK